MHKQIRSLREVRGKLLEVDRATPLSTGGSGHNSLNAIYSKSVEGIAVAMRCGMIGKHPCKHMH